MDDPNLTRGRSQPAIIGLDPAIEALQDLLTSRLTMAGQDLGG
jgi:hypothetical protein